MQARRESGEMSRTSTMADTICHTMVEDRMRVQTSRREALPLLRKSNRRTNSTKAVENYRGGYPDLREGTLRQYIISEERPIDWTLAYSYIYVLRSITQGGT